MLELPFEIWKDIPGFEGYYQASNKGRIRSVEKTVNCVLGKKHTKALRRIPSKILKKGLNVWGYECVSLYKNGVQITKTVHKLVALTFIPNPDNLPQINHKDENKLNNAVSNLEWCDAIYNCGYGTRNKRISNKRIKAIAQFTLDGELVKIWVGGGPELESVFGHNTRQSILSCCQGKYGYKTAYGYKWKYYEKGN